MTKYPFTPAGFQQLQSAMYALSDSDLRVQAQEILTDLSFWVEAHFELLPHQVAYMNALHSVVKTNIAENASLAFGHRLPIILVKEERSARSAGDPEPDPEDEEKLIRPKPKTIVTGNDQGGYQVEGSLEIEILYLI